ncbi:DUF7146 domain-containing protein [Erythrobacter ani]|uniref:DUF7146 domain-containing protein n=1 Tax=Erythrobacter ani TaxID=2827235 RepID=A0ABS6SSA1_9SPHN|nr:hypothetical protein [Erythrobacter ani]MBV7267534.1 hypothetical protein [Erythrobacter ani]
MINDMTIASAERLWESSVSTERTIADDYLRQLGASQNVNSVRFNIACQPTNFARGRKFPAALFGFRNIRGDLLGVERHFLDPDTGEVLSRDYIGRSSFAYWFTARFDEPQGFPFVGTMCVTQGIERALELSNQTGCICGAVLDIPLLNDMTAPADIYEVCFDDENIESALLAKIMLAFRGRAYVTSTISERFSQEAPAVA